MECVEVYVDDVAEILPVVGIYGLFSNTIVLYKGDEIVTSAGYRHSETGEITDRCQSTGCGYCSSVASGCRHCHKGDTAYAEVWCI